MKKVYAYVKPFKLESLLQKLPEEGVHEVLVSEVRRGSTTRRARPAG